MRRLVRLAGVAVVPGSLALLALLVLPALNPAAEAPSRRSGDPLPAPAIDPSARARLERAAAAPYVTRYSGTLYVTAWTSSTATSQVLQVEHSPATGTTRRAVGATSESSVVRTAAHSADPSILGGVGAVALMARHYSLAEAGGGRVSGRAADVVEARRPGPAGAARPVVARYWLDRETGLVLRREVYDRLGHVRRASAFVDVTVGAGRPAAGAGESGRAWSEALDLPAVARMRRNGWTCPGSLPGPLPLVDARRGGEDGDIVHLSYADGIASISVFQQRGSLDRGRLDDYRRETSGGRTVWVRDEVPRRVVWSLGGTVYTVVADAPERTVDRAVDTLHDDAAAGGGETLDRLGRGLGRVASWFNPFE